ncbi:hypothetical protein KKB18_10155 [bacterium]|nr:hypothetical protein [bacterium]
MRKMIASKLAIPLLMRFSKGNSFPLYRELIEYDFMNRDKLFNYQWEKFKTLIEYAKKNIPYYAESFEETGIHAKDLTSWNDLLKIPMLNKSQISANFPDRITPKNSKRDTWEYGATSGTTDRLMIVTDIEDNGRGESLTLYERQLQGNYSPGDLYVSIPPDACSMACAASVKRNLRVRDHLKKTIDSFTVYGIGGVPRSLIGRVLRRLAYPSHEMPSFGAEGTRIPPETLQWYVDKIRNLKPEILSGLPEFLQLLARHIDRTGENPPQIGKILPEASLSSPSLKKELNRIFHVPVHEVYGGHEFGGLACTCERGDRMHVLMPVGIVEAIRDGRNVPFGELGEIVVTTFNRLTMPLIRYRPGDVGRIYDDYCECGRKTLLICIEGRFLDTIVTSKGIFTSQRINEFFTAYPNIDFFQLVQRSENRFDLSVVEKESGCTNLHDLSDAAENFFGEEIKVRPRLVSTIKPEESGKFRFVKSFSHQHFHEITPSYNQPLKEQMVLNQVVQ